MNTKSRRPEYWALAIPMLIIGVYKIWQICEMGFALGKLVAVLSFLGLGIALAARAIRPRDTY